MQKGYSHLILSVLGLLLCCYRPVSFVGEHKEQQELSETSFYFLDNLQIILVSLGGWEGVLWGWIEHLTFKKCSHSLSFGHQQGTMV